MKSSIFNESFKVILNTWYDDNLLDPFLCRYFLSNPIVVQIGYLNPLSIISQYLWYVVHTILDFKTIILSSN